MINNYQKLMIVWGILLGVGYGISTSLLANPVGLLVLWTIVIAVGLALQVWWGWPRDTKATLIQLVWIGVILIGAILTYAEMRLGILLGLHGMTSGWFFICSSGMLLTAIIYRLNISYIILFILYGVAGVLVAFSGFGLQVELYLSAVGFFGLCLLDALLEKSAFRTHLAD